MWPVTFFVLTILISYGSVNAEAINPLKNPGICGTPQCDIDPDNEKFHYQQNVVYKYLYESAFETLFDGTDDTDPASELHISAMIELIFPSKCQGQIKVINAQLKHYNLTAAPSTTPKTVGDYEYDEEEEEKPEPVVTESSDPSTNVLHTRSSLFAKDIEDMNLRFDFRDGVIEEICPNNDEQVWVMNFKRGILSALQNTMTRLDLDHKATEVDVSGKCEVSYQFVGAVGTSILINKTKDISSCQSRNKFKSIIQTTPYEFRKSGISWWPIYDSSSYCEMSIDNYIYNNIECHERHKLIPFSNAQNGAVTKSFMRLKLLEDVNETFSDDIYIEKRKNLLYDHTFSPKPVHNDVQLSRRFLIEMCNLGTPNIQREFPDQFVKFLSATRQLSLQGLKNLLGRAGGICKTNKSNGRKHVLESLPYIESAASIELMKTLLMDKSSKYEITEETKEAWMLSLFYLPRPDHKIIESMFSLIQFYEIEQNPMLVLIPTSVTHTFCRNVGDCKHDMIVMNIVKYLEGIVVANLPKDLNDRKTYEKLIVAMKGIGNIGIVSQNLRNNLLEIIVDESYSDDVKVQAIQLFRKTNCNETREFFFDIYRNFTQTPEVRISSFLHVMKCPSYLTIKDIREFLKVEKVNQVGSFVWSHLTNLGKTSSPLKLHMQALLADNVLDEKFNLDFRKFSKNYENSLFFDEYNFGVTGESNVIFGTESYIPRSISFNGTINLFGGSINPFEFNIRMQGLEKYIESIFGLEGSYNFARIVEGLRSYLDVIKGYLDSYVDFEFLQTLLRPRRSTSETENFLEGFAYKPNYDFNSPNGYFEHKIYGNDINFYHFNNFKELKGIVEKLVPLERIKNIFSSKREVFIDSGTLVDVSYTVPSSSGFPIVLSAFGAYSLDISYFASINNKNPWETKSLDFTGKLRPSLSMELNTAMQVDLFYDTTEIKFKSNVYSNYAFETDIVLKNYTKASVKLKLPQERNDIFSIRTQLIGKLEGKENLLYGITDKYNGTSCTWPAVEETIGLQVCIDYNLPDVSNQVKNYPSLILSGPINFDIHLDKADSSAKIYTFDYNWKSNNEGSEGSIVFETPGTKIPRKLSAILLTNPTDYNFTMKLINGVKTQTFLGMIKYSPLIKSLDFSISQNEKTYLLLEMKFLKEIISKTRSKTTPSLFLTIKGQKVFGLSGTVATTDKSGTKHHQFSVTCETKRLYSLAKGTLTSTDTMMTLNTELTYKFPGKEAQSVDILLELANRSQKKTELIGSLKFESSYYPQLNFILNGTFISSLLGHAELKFDFNNAADLQDPNYTTTMRISLAKHDEDSKTSETTFFIDVKRPVTLTDLKFYVKYDERYKNGTEHNAVVIVRISPEKEAEGKASVFIPKGNLFGFDSTFLLKLPDMGSCSAKIVIMEKIRKDYAIDMSGEWFSKENITIKGTYEDRTSTVKRFHRLKTYIRSNMFDDVNLNVKYSRDLSELKFKLDTEYKTKLYSFLLEKLEEEELVDIFKSELNWAEYAYSVNANLSRKGIGRTKVEIHLDLIRDMHIEIWGLAKTFSRNAGFEFKWDANRDPSQKFALSYEFDSPREKYYIGNILVSYPERTINGDVKISNESPYTGLMRISWGPDDVIDATYSVGSEFDTYKKLWALLKVDTPFTGWRNNKINGTIYQEKNLFEMKFESIWAESQSVDVNFFIDYLISDSEISGDLRGSIESTIDNIPKVFSHLKYNQTRDELETDVLFKYKNESGFKTFRMESLWKKSYNEIYRNITGHMKFISPIENYTSGALITKFSLTTDRELYGVIDMDIDSRQYAFAVEGYLRKLFDNMISFNISTPIETFPSLLGKFGINEHKKFLIADLKTHNKSLGVEFLFDFQSITDFDLKFYVATPQPALEKILAIGTIRGSVMHIEGAWNKITIGFKRISHYANFNDFEYSYQVFTPLTNFEQNGLIMKIIAKDIQNFDIETSLKLGKYKLGVQAYGEPKKQLITQLGLTKATYIREEMSTDDLDSAENSENSNFDIDLEKFYSLVGRFEICTIIWTPITGNYEIQQIDETFHGDARIIVPKGVIALSNRFVIKSPTDIANKLKIDTPILEYRSIISNFKVKIPPNEGFTTRFDVNIKKKNLWNNYGFKLSYALPPAPNSKIHDLSLIILYPIMNTSRINIKSTIEIAKSGASRANFSLDGFKTNLLMSGSLERTSENFNSAFNVELRSPVIPHYVFSTYVQKTSINKENKINAGFKVDDNKFDTELLYRDTSHVIDGYFTVSSNIFPINKFNSSVLISEGKQPRFDIQMRYELNEKENEIKFLILKEGKNFKGEISTPLSEFSDASFMGEIIENSGAYNVKGKVFIDTSPYDFEGTVGFTRNIPSHADLTIKKGIKISYNLRHESSTRKINASITQNAKSLKLESELYIESFIDWAYNIKLLSSREELNEIKLSTSLTPNENKSKYSAVFFMETPWKAQLIDKVSISSEMKLNPIDGDVKLLYEISKYEGNAGCVWKWLQKQSKQDYLFKIFTNSTDKNFQTEFSYLSPKNSPTNVAFAIDVNSLWMLSTKAKYQGPSTDMTLVYDLSLPNPIKSDHHIEARYIGSSFPPKIEKNSKSDCMISYKTSAMSASLKAKGKIETFSTIDNFIALEWGNDSSMNKIGSDFSLEKVNEKSICKWELLTPQSKNEKTLVVNANYDALDVYKLLHADINYPESNRVVLADIAFADMQNTKGAINTSLPLFNMSWVHIDFNFDNMQEQEKSVKIINASWPENYALIDSMSTYKNSSNHQAWTGVIKAEIPLQTRHNIQIIYGLEEKPLITTGHGFVEYNDQNILNSTYTCKTEKSGSNQLKDIIDLSLENQMRPIGIHYTHEKKKRPAQKFEYNKKHLELFDLSRDNRFNITGDFIVEIKDTEQKYKFIAQHPRRTITWSSDYKSLDTQTHQRSKLELAPNIWLEYDFELSNTSKTNEEGQELKFELSYPVRKIIVGGNYTLKSSALDADVTVKWNKREKVEGENEENYDEMPSDEEEFKSITGQFQWKDLTGALNENHQSVLLALKHPKFEKDLTLLGSYYKGENILSKIELDVDYSEDEDKHAKFVAVVKDLSEEVNYKNYSVHVFGDHQVSNLNLLFEGSVGFQSNLYKIEATASHERGYLPKQDLELIGFIDLDNREVKYYRQVPSQLDHIYGIFKPKFPVYSVESIYIDGDKNTKGDFVLDLKQKFITGDVDLTEDGSQRIQVRGNIPDTRSADFNIWRDYDDKRIDDVSYFIQMNHSRLITSKFLWRPKIKKEIKENIKSFMASRYTALSSELDYWVHIFYTETKDIIIDIWGDADTTTLYEFYNDLKALQDIDEDLLAFRNFLNESYNADDFYVQSFMNYTVTIMDELAIADHIQTIPKFFKEMWVALGESSSAFTNSVKWMKDMIKASYKESLETFNKLLHGNAMEYVTQLLNTIIENYDKFVKELHIKFINYVESMWDNLALTLSSYWSKILESIEPQIIRSIHYVETTLWSISSEIFDFMYNRTNEIIESPYFMRVSNITRDMDKLYIDLKTNDLFTNVKKYSGLLFNFAKEKFLRMPFAAELREVLVDLGHSLKDLRNVEGIKEYFDQLEEIQSRIKWLMNEFQLDKRLNALLEILKKKLSRITQNALETEDVYREAKTKFIFDPEVGKIIWEQKLPISWHAFNETPQFEEIPEYKMFNDAQTFLFGAKNNSWNFFNGIFMTDPQNLIPPFKAHALLVGSRHIVTFDKTSLEFDASEYKESKILDDQCSYLLAHDFIDGHFTIILKPSSLSLESHQFLSKTLLIKSKNASVEIELGNPVGKIRVGNHDMTKDMTVLPTTSGDFLITRELNVVTVESKRGFKVQCNLEFDVCKIELSGWFFGKIAGVLGTMNNENFDDLTTADNDVTENKEIFLNSWVTTGNRQAPLEQPQTESEFYGALLSSCDSYYKQKTSYFTNCFLTVDPQPFYEMCIQLGTLPRYQTSSKNMEQAACTSAIAYIDACAGQNIPLRIPDTCIYCNLPNGSYVTEGVMKEFKDGELKPSVDVVFLIESKECNVEASRKNMLNTFVNSFTKELESISINDVRFAVMTFGGSKEYEKPKSITSDGKVFTDAKNIQAYFNHVKAEKGKNSDVFSVVTRASELIFKPGAVKIFVLSLCSECQLNLLKFDFKSVSQLLSEKDIVLHLLTRDPFNIRKAIGIDNKKAYLKTDAKTKLTGDEALKAKVNFGRKLQLCTSLALETEGSVFSGGNKTNENELKIIANVFAKRVAVVHPKPCHQCECEGHNSGTAYFTCYSCEYMNRIGNEGTSEESLEDYLEK